MMQKIGISPGFIHPDSRRDTYSAKTLNYLETDTAKYVLEAGALPVLIPFCSMVTRARILKELDGLILQGGEDVAPETYSETPIGPWPGDRIRDTFEWEILIQAMYLELPIFGICRGCQMLNVYFGGSLYQDIPTQLPNAAVHKDKIAYDLFRHPIAFAPGKLLDRIYSETSVRMVNSIHHQGIKDLASPLEVLAHHPEDGLVEAVQHTGYAEGKIMGIQWHPEFNYRQPDDVISSGPVLSYWLRHVRARALH